MSAFRCLLLTFALCLLSPSVFAVDSDSDSVDDQQDNCIEIANTDQRDSNGDGFGNAFRPYEIQPNGVDSIGFPLHAGPYQLNKAYKDLLTLGGSSHKMINKHMRIQQRENQFSQLVSNALANAPVFTQAFGNGSLQKQLEMVAKLIAVRKQLDSTVLRQVFFVQLGGWDTHASQNAAIATSHPSLLSQLGQSLDAFHAALVELGLDNQVATFTASEFGRSLTPNGDGTDHG